MCSSDLSICFVCILGVGLSSYSAPLYIDVKKTVTIQSADEIDPETGDFAYVPDPDAADDEEGTEHKVSIGKVSPSCSNTFGHLQISNTPN